MKPCIVKILGLAVLATVFSSCFPSGVRERGVPWNGSLKVKVGAFPEIDSKLDCRLVLENALVSGKCQTTSEVFGNKKVIEYTVSGTLNAGDSSLKFSSERDSGFTFVGTFADNQFSGDASVEAGGFITNYSIEVRRVVPVSDNTYDASGRWNLTMSLKDQSGRDGVLNLTGSCYFRDSGGDLSADCDLTDSRNRLSPRFTGTRSSTRARLAYTSLLQDVEITFNGSFTDPSNFAGRGFLRDLQSSYGGTVNMRR